jgi:tRNA(Ile)-lysidine synthase
VRAAEAAPVSVSEGRSLFADLVSAPALVLAVSGGPDSTALLYLAARWRAARRTGPKLIAVTVDHGLRPESAAEARAVARLARELGVSHRTLRWRGPKPKTGLQQAARRARYDLLAQAAGRAGAHHVLTAHTADDQAETVLLRLLRGSGVSGLAAMARVSPLPVSQGGTDDIVLVRPFLKIAKARLLATLHRARLDFAEDPSNRDPRFTRPRLRALMPTLAEEGLSAERLCLLADRVRRSEAAIEAMVIAAAPRVIGTATKGPIAFDAPALLRLPDEIVLRLVGRAIAQWGDEGPVELGKLEALCQDLFAGRSRRGKAGVRRRTLAGAVVTRTGERVFVERAPPRRGGAKSRR